MKLERHFSKAAATRPARGSRLGPLIAMACVLAACPLPAALQWQRTEATFKATPQQEAFEAGFSFRNTGRIPVNIVSIRTTCGCTTAALEKRTYAPGERGTIRAVFTFGGRTGLQYKSIYVGTDDPDSPLVKLVISGEIPPVVQLTPRFLGWTLGEAPAAKAARVSLQSPDATRISQVESSSQAFQVRLQPSETESRVYNLEVRPVRTDQPAQAVVTVYTQMSDGFLKRSRVWVRVQAEGESPHGED